MVWFLKHLWFGIYGCWTILLFEKVNPINSWDLSILSHVACRHPTDIRIFGNWIFYSISQFRQILQLQKAVGNISSSVSGPWLTTAHQDSSPERNPRQTFWLTGLDRRFGVCDWKHWLPFFFGLEHLKTNDFTGFSTSQWWKKQWFKEPTILEL